MNKKLLCTTLVLLLINVAGLRTIHASSTEEKQARFVETVRENILKLGTGPDASIEVKLRDNTKVKGYILAAGDESFLVVNAKTRATETIPYPQVKHVKGHNLSSGAKIAIGVGIAVGVFTILVLIFKDHIMAY
jgi:hypothetical protein